MKDLRRATGFTSFEGPSCARIFFFLSPLERKRCHWSVASSASSGGSRRQRKKDPLKKIWIFRPTSEAAKIRDSDDIIRQPFVHVRITLQHGLIIEFLY